MKTFHAALAGLVCLLGCRNKLFAQAEVSGWGNLRGIRVGGQLVEFTTAVGAFSPDFAQLTLSQREGPIRTTQYVRNGNTLTVGESLTLRNNARGPVNPRAAGQAATAPAATPVPQVAGPGAGRGGAGGFNYTIRYTDSAPAACDVNIQLTSPAAHAIGGIYYFLNLPGSEFTGRAELIGFPTPTSIASIDAPATQPATTAPSRFFSGDCTGVRFTGTHGEKVEADFPRPLTVVIQRTRTRGNSEIQAYFPIVIGPTTAGQTASASFTIKADADVESGPVTVTVDPAKTGRPWLGIGGNYRIQNQRVDPLHIQYIFDNMRVAYGRVALPWNEWQPDENIPPAMTSGGNAPQTAPATTRGRGRGPTGVLPALDIAQKLAKRNIPTIISCWFPPAWATLPNDTPNVRGMRLNPAKWDAICKSLGSYLIYLRDHYGAEPQLFSFNESNLGINVRQTPQDHDEAITRLGAYFKSLGLKTRMLVGDTSDAVAVDFLKTAVNDPEAAAYAGAVSFHSWRGATDAQYQQWADAAAKLGVPLIDAEGGNDAEAYSYSNIFLEGWYALDEAAEYVRIMRICQPESILEWQFTQNYSVLWTDPAGGLHPTQRFYNLKQFNLAPAGSAWTSVQSSSPLVLPAAFVDANSGVYTIHLVNNGAARQVTVTGLPSNLTAMNVYVTDKDRGMTPIEPLKFENGSAQFKLPSQALTTLSNAGP